MLRQRVLTALVLAPLAIGSVLALPTFGFSLLLGVIVLLAGWEWSRLVGWDSAAARLAYSFTLGALMLGLYPLLSEGASVVIPGAVGLLWWLVALTAVWRFPTGSAVWQRFQLARSLAGALILVPAWACLVLLQQAPGPGFVLLLLILIWGADTGAYFAGRRWGRHRLAPRVSPGKTWEGVGGGAALALGAGLVGWFWLQPDPALLPFLALCGVTIAFSVLGDLSESMFKRLMAVKDSGGLLPGHGGILDRIDSLTAAAPVFALGLYGLERLA